MDNQRMLHLAGALGLVMAGVGGLAFMLMFDRPKPIYAWGLVAALAGAGWLWRLRGANGG